MLCLHIFRQTGPPTTGRLVGPSTCLPHEDGGIPLSALPKYTTSELAGLPICNNVEPPVAVADINECKVGTHNCSQHCNNTDPGFKCWCGEGYELSDDGVSCKGCCCCWLPDPFRGMEAWRKTMEPQKPATPRGLDQRSYRDRESPKSERRKESVAGQCRMR